MELKRKLFKVNGSLDSILSPMIFFFFPWCVFLLKNTLQECWILAGLLLFSFVSTFFFSLEENLLPWNLTSNNNSLSWSCGILVEVGTLPASYKRFLTNQTMSNHCNFDYLRRIRPPYSFLYEIEKFWFGLQPCQKLDFLLDCKNNLLFQL